MFDHNKYTVFYLNNMDGAKVFGHNAILVVNKDGTSDFYSYMGTGGLYYMLFAATNKLRKECELE